MSAMPPDDLGTISWRDLVATAGDRVLLHPSSGTAYAGRLLAIMGPSGAGKSVLLHSLAGLAPASARVSGDVWDATSASRVGVADGTIALVEQDVPFFAELTPLETVKFAAELQGLSSGAATRTANTLLQRVGLASVSARRVGERFLGSSGAGLSGGELRRLGIACALAGDDEHSGRTRRAKALLVDEPTTGLDAFQAAETVELLRELAVTRGCASIITIHQPRSSVWQMIDDVLLLAPGGRVVQCGPKHQVLENLSRLGHACPREGVNPADFLVDLISVNTSRLERRALDEERITVLANAFADSQKERVALSPLRANAERHRCQNRPTANGERVAVSPSRAFCLLFVRALKVSARETATLFGRLMASVGLGFIFAAQFGRFIGTDTISASSVSSRVGMLSFGGIAMAYIGMMRALDRLGKEKKVILRERAASRYNGAVYVAAKALAELPTDALLAAVFGFIVSARCGLRGPAAQIAGVCALVALSSAALGLLVGAVVPNGERALVAGVPVMVLHMLTGVIDPAGRESAMPNPLMLALRKASPIRYALDGLLTAELAGAQLAPSPGDVTKMGGVALARSGTAVLEQLGIDCGFRGAMLSLLGLCFLHLAAAAAVMQLAQLPFQRARPEASAGRAAATSALRVVEMSRSGKRLLARTHSDIEEPLAIAGSAVP